MRNSDINSLFATTEDLAQYVNVNPSFQIDKIYPYVGAAVRTIVRPIVGNPFLNTLFADTDKTEEFKAVIAPLAMMLATHELSVNFGDSGHTVSASKTLLPASDMKVTAYRDACNRRGFAELDAWLCSEYRFEPGNFIAGVNDLIAYLGVRVAHPCLIYDMLRPAFDDIAKWELNTILSGDQYDMLFDGSSGSHPEWEPLLQTVKKYVLKRAFVRVLAKGIIHDGCAYNPELEQYNPATMQSDADLLLDLIRAQVRQLEQEQPDPHNSPKKHFSCIY